MRMQNKGTLYTPGENFKRCNHFGKQQNSWACSLKKKKQRNMQLLYGPGTQQLYSYSLELETTQMSFS